MQKTFERSERLKGVIKVPGDKSISHRAAIIGAISSGTSRITGFSPAEDCRSTLRCLRALGVEVRWEDDSLGVEGRGEVGLLQPEVELDAGNSATTMRLLAGVLAARPLTATLTGDESLLKRPMSRVMEPLGQMGAKVSAGEGGRPPRRIHGRLLSGIEYSPPVASAQVKSAVLLAGLSASGTTTVSEFARTRDHTERMLEHMGIEVRVEGLSVGIEPGVPQARELQVPGDFSSAAFLLAAALVCPGSNVTVTSVGLNPTRTGFLDILRRMDAQIDLSVEEENYWEPRGDISVRHSLLSAIELDAQEVASAIDEVTLVALLATQAWGRTVIRGAAELRHKESDRIGSTVAGLAAMGAEVEEIPDGMIIKGPCKLKGAGVSCMGDHRLAMMFAVAGLAASGRTVVDDWEWTDVSYPGFFDVIRELGGRAVE